MENPCNRFKWWYARKKVMPLRRARLTHLAPQDCAFDCSKPQSVNTDEPAEAPPLRYADSYYRYLDRALADPHVYNIALAGHFGCGKSTILRTFEKHYAKKRRFLNISLATFGDEKQSTSASGNEPTAATGAEKQASGESDSQSSSTETSPEKNGNGETPPPANEPRRQNHLIEHSILQQLFYQVPKSRIPRSRFKRISKPGGFWPWATFLFWIVCVGAAVALFKPELFTNARYVHGIITAKTGPASILVTIGGLLAFALPAIIAFHKLRCVTLRKLNVKNCEIEIADEKDPSALNKHLDEILYFFEETDFDVIVLEDLDRFKTTEVFTKLREINTLVNRNIEARRRAWWRYRSRTPRRVVFIYAIKDDMFTGEERTKFFDLVIPVIPVVNHTNSRELLTQALHARGYTDIDDELINDVAIFVRDMRLLHNVVNEYIVYRRRLNMKGLDPEKLFAMILYKNVCPEDFAKLHNSEGELHSCIGSKVGLVEKATVEFRGKQQSLRARMNLADAEHLRSVQELRKLYILELQRQWSKQVGRLFPLELGGEPYHWESLTEDAPFRLLAETTGHVQSPQGHVANLQFPQAEKAVDPSRTYAEREDLILSHEGKRRKQLEQKLAELDDRIRELRHAKLAELLETVGQDALPSGTLPVVKVLLRRGYIDETTYLSYLSYFYEGSLNNADWVFVQGIKQGQPFEPDYALGNVEEIVERNLGPDERSDQACKNIHILNYMARERRLDFPQVVERLKRAPEEAVELVLLHLADGSHLSVYVIQLLHRHWPEFWQAVMAAPDLSTSDWKRYASSVILHLSTENLKLVLDRTKLRQEVAGDERFVQALLDLEKAARATAFLDTVRPCFLQLPELDANTAIMQHIHEHDFYAITRHNIILLHRAFIGDLPDDLPPSITSLRDHDTHRFAKYVEENLCKYVDVLIKAEGALRREAEPTIVSLLNDGGLGEESLQALCDGRCVPIEQLAAVEASALWADILTNRAASPSWENVLAYHHECADEALDDILIGYLSDDDVASSLSQEVCSFPCKSGDRGTSIMGQIPASERISTSSVAKLLKALPDGAIFADASAIAKAHLPVAHPWIKFTAENYEHVRVQAPSSIGAFAKDNRDRFYALLGTLTVEGKDLGHILDAHSRKNRKREIVSTVFEEAPPSDLAPVAGQVCTLMFDSPDFAETFDSNVLADVFASVRDRATKIAALTQFMPQLSDEGVLAVLESAGGRYSDVGAIGKRPVLTGERMNEDLAAALKARELICSFNVMKDGIRIENFRKEE